MVDRRRTDTRDRVQAIAMELFTEKGYEQTSMREIAERVGVTKAALYYHFPTKQEIVDELFTSIPSGIESIVQWASSQPPGPELRDEILVRYGRFMHDQGQNMARFFYANQSAFEKHQSTISIRTALVQLSNLIAAPSGSPADVFYARQALLTVGWGASMMGDIPMTDAERFDHAIELARAILPRISDGDPQE